MKAKWNVMNEEQLAKVAKEEALKKEIAEIQKQIDAIK